MVDLTPSNPSRGHSAWTPSALGRAVTNLARHRPKPAKRRRAATDELKLFCMGYRQELARKLTLFNNAGVAFSLLTPLTAVTGTYGAWGLPYGGPVVMMWGFPIVSLFSLLVSVSLAELASAYPTSGAVYYWTWVLAPPRFKAVGSWMTGWLMLLGQATFTAATGRMFTEMLEVFVLMATGVQLSSGLLLGVFIVVLAAAAAAASTSNAVTAFMTSLSTFWNLVSLAALAVALPVVAPKRQSASYIFTNWSFDDALTGVRSNFYNMLLGLTMSQYVYLGFDSCAHMSEETQHAEINTPRGMLAATATAAVTGYCYLLSLNACTVDPEALLAPNSESHGKHAVAQLFWNVHKAAYGDGRGGLALLTVPMLSSLFCVHQCIVANSRMLFAFSRDGAMPLNRYLSRVDKHTRAPLTAVWMITLIGVVLGIPMYFATPYVATMFTVSIVNTYLAYGLPILCKLVNGRSSFLPGPFFTGRRISRTINAIALLWVVVVAVIFSLPAVYPITAGNMNYNAAGTVLSVLGSLIAFYFPKVGGRYWFTGPRPNLGQFDDLTPLMQHKMQQRQRQKQPQQQQSESQQQQEQSLHDAAGQSQGLQGSSHGGQHGGRTGLEQRNVEGGEEEEEEGGEEGPQVAPQLEEGDPKGGIAEGEEDEEPEVRVVGHGPSVVCGRPILRPLRPLAEGEEQLHRGTTYG